MTNQHNNHFLSQDKYHKYQTSSKDMGGGNIAVFNSNFSNISSTSNCY